MTNTETTPSRERVAAATAELHSFLAVAAAVEKQVAKIRLDLIESLIADRFPGAATAVLVNSSWAGLRGVFNADHHLVWARDDAYEALVDISEADEELLDLIEQQVDEIDRIDDLFDELTLPIETLPQLRSVVRDWPNARMLRLPRTN